MFAYPKQTEFNQVVSKAKIYTQARASKRIKELFVIQVDEIVWKHKLSPETLNLPARSGINEIQVFELQLKTEDLDDAVLQTIDKVVLFPILFQLVHDRQVRFAMSYKRPSEADSTKWVTDGMFQTAPQPVDLARPPLPVVLDLAGFYEQVLRRHIPLLARDGEGITDHIARCNALDSKKKAQQKLRARLAQEKQFNRKVKLNAELRELDAELASLQRS